LLKQKAVHISLNCKPLVFTFFVFFVVKMPKGRHKGKSRSFTNFKADELKAEKEEKQKAWRAQRGEISSSDEESGSGSESSSEESGSGSSGEEEVKERKPKGVAGLIEFENPNRPLKAPKEKKAKDVQVEKAASSQLTRRQKEEMAKQRYEAMHAAGKTDQARADLERLAIIRAKRQEADSRKREDAEAKAAAAKAAAAKPKK